MTVFGLHASHEQVHPSALLAAAQLAEQAGFAVHNLSVEPVTVPLVLPELPAGTRLVELLRDGSTDVAEGGSCELAVDGYGFRWLRVLRPDSRRLT